MTKPVLDRLMGKLNRVANRLSVALQSLKERITRNVSKLTTNNRRSQESRHRK